MTTLTHTRQEGKRLCVQFDQDADLSYLDQPEFADTNREDIVSYYVVAERECESCGHWNVVDSLGGCEFMEADHPDMTGRYDTRESLPEDAQWLWDSVDWDAS